MELTLTGFLFGMALLAVPLLVVVRLQIGLTGQFLRALSRMLASSLLAGGCLWLAERYSHWALNLLLVLLMAAFYAGITPRLARVSQRNYLIPAAVGMGVSLLLTLAYLWVFVVGVHVKFLLGPVIPLAGLLLGTMTAAVSSALRTYYAGILHHGQLYEYLLGNGATHREAVWYFVRRAVQSAFLPYIKTMSTLFISVCPLVVWSMMLSGVSALSAVGWQLLLVVASLFATLVALLAALWTARHYAFDAYEALVVLAGNTPQPVDNKEKE
ncbi:MAG: ABC transporter permease [Prevotella sp.]|nr:ABC transporter permease [Prevotella sp.]